MSAGTSTLPDSMGESYKHNVEGKMSSTYYMILFIKSSKTGKLIYSITSQDTGYSWKSND